MSPPCLSLTKYFVFGVHAYDIDANAHMLFNIIHLILFVRCYPNKHNQHFCYCCYLYHTLNTRTMINIRYSSSIHNFTSESDLLCSKRSSRSLDDSFAEHSDSVVDKMLAGSKTLLLLLLLLCLCFQVMHVYIIHYRICGLLYGFQ